MDKLLDIFKLEVCEAISVPPGHYFKRQGKKWLLTVSESQSWTVLDDIDAKAFIDSDHTVMLFMIIPRRTKQVKGISDLFDMI